MNYKSKKKRNNKKICKNNIKISKKRSHKKPVVKKNKLGNKKYHKQFRYSVLRNEKSPTSHVTTKRVKKTQLKKYRNPFGKHSQKGGNKKDKVAAAAAAAAKKQKADQKKEAKAASKAASKADAKQKKTKERDLKKKRKKVKKDISKDNQRYTTDNSKKRINLSKLKRIERGKENKYGLGPKRLGLTKIKSDAKKLSRLGKSRSIKDLKKKVKKSEKKIENLDTYTNNKLKEYDIRMERLKQANIPEDSPQFKNLKQKSQELLSAYDTRKKELDFFVEQDKEILESRKDQVKVKIDEKKQKYKEKFDKLRKIKAKRI